MSAFFLFTEETHTRIKSYSGTINGAKATVRIQLEIDDPDERLGYLLRQLKEFQEEQKRLLKPAPKSRARKPKPKQITEQRPLALPAPTDFEL